MATRAKSCKSCERGHDSVAAFVSIQSTRGLLKQLFMDIARRLLCVKD